MTNWGAVSSWVAAGVSIATFGAGTVRAWWNRPHVDWSLQGKVGWPNSERPGFTWLEGGATFTNFGDGPAHRVSVHIHRGDAPESQTLGSASLLRPGEAIEFKLGVSAEHWDDTYLWVTWTRPPIRRHREQTSAKLLVCQHVELTDIAGARMARWVKERTEMDALAADFAEGKRKD